MNNVETKKYVRTKSGDFWEYTTVEYGSKVYTKPGCSTLVPEKDDSIVSTADTVIELVRAGDIVKFKNGHAESIDSDDSYVLGAVVEIYTQCGPLSDYKLVAVKHNGEWIIK